MIRFTNLHRTTVNRMSSRGTGSITASSSIFHNHTILWNRWSSSNTGSWSMNTRCHLLRQSSPKIVRSLSSTTTTPNNNANDRRYNESSSSTQQQQQQSYDSTTGSSSSSSSSGTFLMNNRNHNMMIRNPIVLTNMKSTSSTNSYSYNSYHRPQLQAPTSTSVVLASQLPRVLSRLTILKYRHLPLLMSKNPNTTSSTSSSNSSLKFPNIPQLSNLFTNHNHGEGIGGSSSNNNNSSRLFSTSSSMDDNIDGEITTTNDNTTNVVVASSSSSSPIPVLLYAVYGKRDFMEIQRNNYIERPISSKEMDHLLQQQQEEKEKEEKEKEGLKEEEEQQHDISSSTDVVVSNTATPMSDDTSPNPVPDNEENDDEDDDDVKENDVDQMVTFAMEADLYSLSEIHNVAEDQFGTSQNLQYYHIGANEWRNLHNDTDLDLFQTFYFECIDVFKGSNTQVVVPIRIPEYYVEKEEDDPDYEEDMTNPVDTESSNVHTLEAMIEHLLQQLIEKKWSCEEHYPPLMNTDENNNDAATSSDDVGSTTNTSSPKVYRLVKEVIYDSKIGIIDESMSDDATTVTSTSSSSSSVVDDTSSNTTTTTATSSSVDDSTVPTNKYNTLDDNTIRSLVDETTTTILSNHDNDDESQQQQEPSSTITKTYMYMNTKNFVISCASKDAALRGLLFYYPNALDHIVECLHYKFLWDNYYLKDMEQDRDDNTSGGDEVERNHDTDSVVTHEDGRKEGMAH